MKVSDFVKKLWPFKKGEPEKKKKSAAALTFEVDEEGTIWIDASWNEKAGSHLVFADLAYKVMYSHLVEETLTFLKDECLREDMEAHFWEVFEYMSALEKVDGLNLTNDVVEPEAEADEVVVKPTEIAKRIRNEE